MGGSVNAKVDHAFRYALDRLPRDSERRSAVEFLRKITVEQRGRSLPSGKERAPLVRSITSELTGAEVRIEEDPDPARYEENLQPGSVSQEVRAMAELALVLFNSNEFIYVY
jgi:hypothetical protein